MAGGGYRSIALSISTRTSPRRSSVASRPRTFGSQCPSKGTGRDNVEPLLGPGQTWRDAPVGKGASIDRAVAKSGDKHPAPRARAKRARSGVRRAACSELSQVPPARSERRRVRAPCADHDLPLVCDLGFRTDLDDDDERGIGRPRGGRLRHDARRRAMEGWSRRADTVDEMRRRACVAASDLPDYEWTRHGQRRRRGRGEDCTNPTFAYCLTPSAGGTCASAPDDAWIAANTCDDPARRSALHRHGDAPPRLLSIRAVPARFLRRPTRVASLVGLSIATARSP